MPTLATIATKQRLAALGLGVVLLAACWALPAPHQPAPRATTHQPAAALVGFTRHIRPILAEHCFGCHGPDAGQRKAGLRLDERSAALGRGRSGAIAIVPGAPQQSELYRRITQADETERMPPPGHGKLLSVNEVRLLEAWIEQGAVWASPWPPLRRPVMPDVADQAWPRNPVDHFVLARLEQDGLRPNLEAALETWLRRVSLDLTGLPPALRDVDSFLADDSPGAYENAVDRLLQSPHFGERMAQLWLDWSRYADSGGKNYDYAKSRWPWRDWVIRAFNTNMPFDRFTIEQLAGDLLPNPTLEQLVATGFNRNGVTDGDGCNSDWDVEESRVEMVADMVNTTCQVWLGLSMSCAQCHDHKHDPISQKDYYRLFAFFQHQPPVRIAAKDAFRNYPPVVTGRFGHNEETSVMVMADTDPGRATHILQRGDFKQKGEKVTPGVPAIFETPEWRACRVSSRETPPVAHAAGAPNRLTLARWLVDPQHPLTSRVLANRLWEMVFGTGLVKTSEDFGARGEPASHPELLDWLAYELVARGWDIKAMLRLLVTSATYRQSSTASGEMRRRDPEGRLLARFPRGRLPAESIRDTLLDVAGLLNTRMAGPPVRPELPPGDVEFFNQRRGTERETYIVSPEREQYRRSVYLLYKRSQVYPPLSVFDAPPREVCQIRRAATTTPLQALVLQNEPAFRQAAAALAQRALSEAGPGTTDRLRFAFRCATGRQPTDGELAILGDYFENQCARYSRRPDLAAALMANAKGDCYEPRPRGSGTVDHSLTVAAGSPAVMAAWTMTGSLLLNLDETISKE